MAGSEFHVTFEGEEIALNLPDTGVVVDSWTITPLTHPVVRSVKNITLRRGVLFYLLMFNSVFRTA